MRQHCPAAGVVHHGQPARTAGRPTGWRQNLDLREGQSCTGSGDPGGSQDRLRGASRPPTHIGCTPGLLHRSWASSAREAPSPWTLQECQLCPIPTSPVTGTFWSLQAGALGLCPSQDPERPRAGSSCGPEPPSPGHRAVLLALGETQSRPCHVLCSRLPALGATVTGNQGRPQPGADHAPLPYPALTRQISKALLQLVLDVRGAERGDVPVHDFICRESRQTALSFGGNRLTQPRTSADT